MRVIGLMQDSRMGVHVNQGVEKDTVVKFGPAQDYLSEFVFEAHPNHRSDLIFLEGLPDVPEIRPHLSVNN